MNWMAIASLVFGIFGFSIIGGIIALTLGNLAREKIKETHERGRGPMPRAFGVWALMGGSLFDDVL